MKRTKFAHCVQHAGGIVFVVLVFLFGAGDSGPARSHEVRPVIATADIQADGTVDLVVSVNLEALIAGIGSSHEDTSKSQNAAHYDRLRSLAAPALRQEAQALTPRLLREVKLKFGEAQIPLTLLQIAIPDVGDIASARVSEIRMRGAVPPLAVMLSWQLSSDFGDSVIRLRKNGEEKPFYSAYLKAGASSDAITVQNIVSQPASAVFFNYVSIGYKHIVPEGVDHILFVIGLFLLSSGVRALLVQITSFTVAHSITLGLAMLGLVQLPASIVEPLIAASIVYVAVENIFTNHLHRWRPVLVFGFGLLHGLGFAGVLTEIGLLPSHFAAGLIGFNVGVELGQLTVISGCFLAIGLWFRTKSWYRSGITVPASVLIALIAAYWFIERVLA